MTGFKNYMMASIFIFALIPGCKKESSEIEAAMEKYANITPSPRSYSECKTGAEIIKEYILQGRDQGVSVDNAIKLLSMLNIDAGLANALGDVFKAVWKSKDSASSLSDNYMEICQK